jgi:hypothetical protein
MFETIKFFSWIEFSFILLLFLVVVFGLLYPAKILKNFYSKVFYIVRGPVLVLCVLSVLYICISYLKFIYPSWF